MYNYSYGETEMDTGISPEHTHLHLLLLSLVIHFDYTWLRQWRGPKCEEEEQTTQWPKRKSTKGQTTIYKTYT